MSTESVTQSDYGYVPNLGGNIAATTLFLIFFIAQIYLMFKYRQWWFGIAFCIGTALELTGYICRINSNTNQDMEIYYMIQIVVLVVAPTFFMAGIYSLPAKLAVIFGYPKVSRVRPRVYSILFLSLDVASLLTQFAGGGIAASATSSSDASQAHLGSNIMLAGMIIQVIGITVFLALFADLLLRARNLKNARAYHSYRDTDTETFTRVDNADDLFNPAYAHVRANRLFPWLIAAIFASTLLIYTRSIYRVVELAEGWNGKLMTTEIYLLILEALLVFLALACLTFIYPGAVLGKERYVLKSKLLKDPASYNMSVRSVPSEDSEN